MWPGLVFVFVFFRKLLKSWVRKQHLKKMEWWDYCKDISNSSSWVREELQRLATTCRRVGPSNCFASLGWVQPTRHVSLYQTPAIFASVWKMQTILHFWRPKENKCMSEWESLNNWADFFCPLISKQLARLSSEARWGNREEGKKYEILISQYSD